KTVSRVLEECEQRNYTWVSLPVSAAAISGNECHIFIKCYFPDYIAKHWTDVNHQRSYADTVPHISQRGFNCSYAGMNAVAYGKGNYFSVDASYSSDDKYSRPDSSGRKHIYVVRVFTGIYTRGHAGIKPPPSKNTEHPTDLYDSVTDDTQHPKLF
ncbi:hypothetical protein HPG69_010456, partial [Diceros bicornis minor]